MVKNWSLRLVLGVFCLTGDTRLGTFQPPPASPPAPLQGERGVICFAYCTLVTGWLVIHQTHPQPSSASPQPLPASPHPLPASPPAPLQGERGVICVIYYTLVICQLVDSLTTRPLPNHLAFLLTWHIANCSSVHFSAIFLTRRVPFLSTNCSPCRKKSILAEVCFKAKRS